jgi:glycosyltransferase involved in cell wall biosynthesis
VSALDRLEAGVARIERPRFAPAPPAIAPGEPAGAAAPALILGRGLHAPWNEGARVIGRNLAHSARLLRPIHVASLSGEQFCGSHERDLHVSHLPSRLPYGAAGDYAALRQVAEHVGRLRTAEPPSVAHLIGLPLALAPWLRRRGMAVVAHATLADHATLGRVERLRAALGWRCFGRWVNAYACSSEVVRAHLAARGYPRRKLHVLPPSIDVHRFRPVDRTEARHAHGIPASAFVVLYVGGISPRRFPAAEVLYALQQVAPEIPELRLHVVAPHETHPANRVWAEEHVRRAAMGAPVPVTLELRDLTEEEKVELYGAADVVILPFGAPVAVEPPLTLLEAMACEATVIVSPHANRSQIVRHWSNGLAYEGAYELAARLRHLHGMGVGRRALYGAPARATVVGGYSIAAATQALAALWSSIGVSPAAPGHEPGRA